MDLPTFCPRIAETLLADERLETRIRERLCRLLTISPSRLEESRGAAVAPCQASARRNDEAQSEVRLGARGHRVELADSRQECSRVERDCDGIEILFEQVSVHIEGHAGLRMAEHSLHCFDVRPG